MKIYSPVKDFNGLRYNVYFIGGVGETDNPQAIEWFRSHGYSVEKCDETPKISTEKCEETHEIPIEKSDEPDFESMSPNELRDWMKENGFGSQIKNTRNKEKLLEIIRG